MELFKSSIARVDTLAIWKNSYIILILKAGEPRYQGHSYCQSSCNAGLPGSEDPWEATSLHHLEREDPGNSFLPALDRGTQTLLPITKVVTGFNEQKL